MIVKVVPVSSPEVAEACKILENTYRAVNIALVNELKVLYDRMGIDVWEVIDAAKTKPFGFQAFYPGPGLGGHCIPDRPVLPDLGGAQVRPDHALHRTGRRDQHRACRPTWSARSPTPSTSAASRSRAARSPLLGMAYKKDVDDPRESPGFELMDLLLKKGAVVSYNDPHIPRLPRDAALSRTCDMSSQPLTPEYLRARTAS